MTLTELMITVALLLVVTGAFLTFVQTMNRGVAIQVERSRANDEVRLAMERLDREVRSSNFIYEPQSPFQTLRIYTQANFPTRTPGFQCVQWHIEGGQLLRRSWPTAQPGSASAWRVHADNIVNEDLNGGEAAFKLDTQNAGRTVDITLYVDVDPDDAVSSPVRLETSLTGRNVPSGYTSSPCDPAPA